jgi:hypothetical protein
MPDTTADTTSRDLAELVHPSASTTGEPEAQVMGRADVVPVPMTQNGELTAAGRKRAGNSLGGKAKRAVALIGLGQANLPSINLRSSDAQLRLLEAVADAVANGRTSSLVATTLIQTVRAAREVLHSDQEALLQAQAREIERLRGGRA